MTSDSMVSCQKGPTRQAYAWQIGPFWQDTLAVSLDISVKDLHYTHNRCMWQWTRIYKEYAIQLTFTFYIMMLSAEP